MHSQSPPSGRANDLDTKNCARCAATSIAGRVDERRLEFLGKRFDRPGFVAGAHVGRCVPNGSESRCEPDRWPSQAQTQAAQGFQSGHATQQRSEASPGRDDEQGRVGPSRRRFAVDHRSRRSGLPLSDGHEAQDIGSAGSLPVGAGRSLARHRQSKLAGKPSWGSIVRRTIVRRYAQGGA